jgi:hypothetical protein
MITFENDTVNVNSALNLLLYPQIKFFVGFVIFAILLRIVYRFIWPDFSSRVIENIVSYIWLLFKTMIYGFLAAIIFFFNFQTKQIVWWHFPDRMLLSTLFVAILAIYEMLSNIIEMVKCAIHIRD